MGNEFGGKVDFDRLKKAIRHDMILIGYPDGMPHSSGKANLDEIALWNSEPEKSTMPARPFIQDGIKANKIEINKLIREQYLNMFKGKIPNCDKIGVAAVAVIKEFVRGEYYRTHVPNKEKTIIAKTSKAGRKKRKKDKTYIDKAPLIDTKQTINGLTFYVEKK